MWTYNHQNCYSDELYHYGVKGMKWGVRRTKEELRYNKSSIESHFNRKPLGLKTSEGIVITKFSDHAGDQARDRKVDIKRIKHAFQKPIYVSPIETDKYGRRSQKYIGYSAGVAVNPDTGVISSVWPIGERKRRKYMRKAKETNVH